MSAGEFWKPSTGQRGMVLVIVLWIVTLLAVMAGSFAYSMRVETRLAASAVERAQARTLAEAGVAYALAWQLDADAQKQWSPNGDPRDWTFGGGRLWIEVTDASGLVDLNNAGLELLKALLAGAGVDARDQDRLAEAIQDWRDHDDRSLPHGAESADYRAAGRSGPNNAPFESVEELGQVLGMTRELHERLARAATVFGRNALVNPELAPARVLQALGLDEQTVADYVDARAQAAAAQAAPPPLPSVGGSFFSSSGRSSVYHVAVVAETETGTSVRVEAVIDLRKAQAGQAARWLAWREGR